MRSLPLIFGQTDYMQQLGTGVHTIAESGCYLCSMAMLARYYGKPVDPVELNKQFIEHNLYINGDLMQDDNLSKIYQDILFVQAYHYEEIPADLAVLKQLVSDPALSVILEIDQGNGNTHFVVCVGVNGVVSIANPWTKQVEDFATHYGDPIKNILKYVVYRGTPVLTDQTTEDQLRLDRDKNWNLYQDQLKQGETVQEQLKVIQEKNNGLQTQVNDLIHKNDSLTQEVKQVNDSNAAIAHLYKTKCEEDATAIDEGVKAKTMADDLKNYIQAIGDTLHVPHTFQDDRALVEEILKEIQNGVHAPQIDPKLQQAMNYVQIVTYLLERGLNEHLSLTKQSLVDLVNYPADPDGAKKVISFYEHLFTPVHIGAKVNNLTASIKKNTKQRVNIFSQVRRFIFTQNSS